MQFYLSLFQYLNQFYIIIVRFGVGLFSRFQKKKFHEMTCFESVSFEYYYFILCFDEMATYLLYLWFLKMIL